MSTGEAPIIKQKMAETPLVHPFSGAVKPPINSNVDVAGGARPAMEPNSPTKTKHHAIFKMSQLKKKPEAIDPNHQPVGPGQAKMPYNQNFNGNPILSED